MQTRYMAIAAVMAAVGLMVWTATAEPTAKPASAPGTGPATQLADAASGEPAARIVYPPTMSIVKRLAQKPSSAPDRPRDETELERPISLLELKPLPPKPATAPVTRPAMATMPATAPTSAPAATTKPTTKPTTEPVVVIKPEIPATKPVVIKPEIPASKPTTEPVVVIKPEIPATKPVVIKPEIPASKPTTEPVVVIKPEIPATKPVVIKPEIPASKPTTEPVVVIKPEIPATEPVVVPFDANKVTITTRMDPNEEIKAVRRPPSSLIVRPSFEPSAMANTVDANKAEELAKPTPLTELTPGGAKPATLDQPPTKVNPPVQEEIPMVASISGPRPPAMPNPLTPTTAPLTPAVDVPDSKPIGSTPRPGDSKLVAASILQVNDQYITVEDVLRGLATKLAEVPRTISEASFREQAEKIIREEVRHQVTESLVYAEAVKRLSDDQKKEIDKEMVEVEREMLAQAGGSKKQLEQNLAKEDMTYESAMQNHRQRVTNNLYLRSRFMPSVVVTRRMLLDYYQKNPAEFQSEKKVQMQILAVPFKEFLAKGTGRPTETELAAARAAAEKYIEEAAAEIKKGVDFGKVVQEKSKGPAPDANGVWPLMAAGSFRETKVEEAAFALPEGKISTIITTDSAFYIVKALKVQPGQSVSFEDAQAVIEKKLHNQQYHKIVDEYFQKLFSERAMIVESDKFMELALTRAVEKYYRK